MLKGMGSKDFGGVCGPTPEAGAAFGCVQVVGTGKKKSRLI